MPRIKHSLKYVIDLVPFKTIEKYQFLHFAHRSMVQYVKDSIGDPRYIILSQIPSEDNPSQWIQNMLLKNRAVIIVGPRDGEQGIFNRIRGSYTKKRHDPQIVDSGHAFKDFVERQFIVEWQCEYRIWIFTNPLNARKRTQRDGKKDQEFALGRICAIFDKQNREDNRAVMKDYTNQRVPIDTDLFLDWGGNRTEFEHSHQTQPVGAGDLQEANYFLPLTCKYVTTSLDDVVLERTFIYDKQYPDL